MTSKNFHAFADHAPKQLICFHHAGGAISAFRPWGKPLAPAIQTCAVQLPGSAGAHRDFDRLIGEIVDVLSPELKSPFALLGHSMGAIVAFAVARELRRREKTMPVHLFALGRTPPQIDVLRAQNLHKLADDEFVNAVQERYGGLPDGLMRQRELLKFFLPGLRADFELIENAKYVEEAPLAVPISVLAGDKDPHSPVPELRRWQELTSVGCTIDLFPGGHFFMKENEAGLLKLLREKLGAQS